MDVLSPEDAQRVFDLLAAKGDEIAFRWLKEGCECRAQLMIEHMQALGIVPGRAWAMSVGRPLSFATGPGPRDRFQWYNHVAPVVQAPGGEFGAWVIDPSLTRAGPLTLSAWASAMRARAIEVSDRPLSQAEILGRQAARALRGQDLDAVVFILELGQPPIPEAGGSGFMIGPDPDEGDSAYARMRMKE